MSKNNKTQSTVTRVHGFGTGNPKKKETKIKQTFSVNVVRPPKYKKSRKIKLYRVLPWAILHLNIKVCGFELVLIICKTYALVTKTGAHCSPGATCGISIASSKSCFRPCLKLFVRYSIRVIRNNNV